MFFSIFYQLLIDFWEIWRNFPRPSALQGFDEYAGSRLIHERVSQANLPAERIVDPI